MCTLHLVATGEAPISIGSNGFDLEHQRGDSEPGGVGETHVGGIQDCLKIVESERHLASHVTGVLRVALGINRSLTRTDQLVVRR